MFWVITDTHFNHFAITKRNQRPLHFEAMVCKNWASKVSHKDTVIHLGDCAWDIKGMKRLLSLPGHKILVRGNHDEQTLGNYIKMGWDFACDSITMRLMGINILFSHKPVWNHTADINIHGHFHDLHREDFSRFYLPMALESMGYTPIALDEEFLGPIRSWIDTHRIPKLKDIYNLQQDKQPLTIRDLYGRHGKEEFVKEFIKHSTMNQSYDENVSVNIDDILEKYGISEKYLV